MLSGRRFNFLLPWCRISESQLSHLLLSQTRLEPKTEPKKSKPNSSVFDSPQHRSVVDSWEPKFVATEQIAFTEPIYRLKPNAQADRSQYYLFGSRR